MTPVAVNWTAGSELLSPTTSTYNVLLLYTVCHECCTAAEKAAHIKVLLLHDLNLPVTKA